MNLNQYFIEPENVTEEAVRQNASYVRKEFPVRKGLVKAELLMSACGLYKAYLNGEEVDTACFLPGFTSYEHRLQYQKYDVTSFLKEGTNCIGAVLGDGWYRGRIGLHDTVNYFGTRIKFLCFMTLAYDDGTEESLYTDPDWKATQDGPIRENDLKGGETYDARRELSGFSVPGFDDSQWHTVTRGSYSGTLVPSLGEPILEQERFRPVVMRTPDGSTVLDFGQNMSGYVRFRVTGPAGWEAAMIHGETLDENGNFTLKNLQLEGSLHQKSELGEAFGQKILYTLREGTQEYKPVFTICGFQYVKLINWPEEVRAENFEAISVYSDVRVKGSFRCSNPLINRLADNVKWSERSNFVDIPTDCPTRERTGWAGDIGVFAESACYLSDPKKFLEKWLRDFVLEQREDGLTRFVAPDMAIGHTADGSAGWADAVYILPLTLYRFYGDRAILETYYENIRKWVDYNQKRAKDTHPDHAERKEDWWNYILDTGFHFGEWLEPGSVMTKDYANALQHPDEEAATAYFADEARSMALIAEILGKKADAEKYHSLFEKIRDAYRKAFLPQGRIHSGRMCRYVRPLQMGLLSGEEAENAAADLNKMVILNDYRIGTGFLTTPAILQVLTKYGYKDTAYRMLENEKQPGWLYSVKKGATTIWENWLGKDDQGVPRDSMNHYSPGSVITWCFSTIAGIRPEEPGYETIRIAPVPGGTLSFAEAYTDTVKGPVRVEWAIWDNLFHLTCEVPGKSIICLPDGSEYRVGKGCYHYICPMR